MSSTSALGKGLDALISSTSAPQQAPQRAASQMATPTLNSETSASGSETVMNADQLVPSEVQPRKYFDDEALKSLATSIKAQGIIQPLLVRPIAGGKYEIIAGERRWRAAQMAGLQQLPVVVRELSDEKALEVAIVENVQRADLNPIDEAEGYLRLVNEFNYTHEEMAKVTGKSRSHITNIMRLLALPSQIRECVSSGLLAMGHARALLPLSENEELQTKAANKVIKDSLSVRQTEDLVRALTSSEKSNRGRRPKDSATAELEQRVSKNVGGLKVAISQKEGAGSIRIFFENKEHLSGLMKKLG